MGIQRNAVCLPCDDDAKGASPEICIRPIKESTGQSRDIEDSLGGREIEIR